MSEYPPLIWYGICVLYAILIILKLNRIEKELVYIKNRGKIERKYYDEIGETVEVGVIKEEEVKDIKAEEVVD